MSEAEDYNNNCDDERDYESIEDEMDDDDNGGIEE